MSRRTEFKGSSAARRRERRAHLQSSESVSSEVMHRPTLSRAQIQAKGKHFTPTNIEGATAIKFVAQDAEWEREEYKRQIERAVLVYQYEFNRPALETGMCLPQVAMYAAGFRKSKAVTAR